MAKGKNKLNKTNSSGWLDNYSKELSINEYQDGGKLKQYFNLPTKRVAVDNTYNKNSPIVNSSDDKEMVNNLLREKANQSQKAKEKRITDVRRLEELNQKSMLETANAKDLYDIGEGMKSKYRFSNENNFFDDYINPFNIVGGVAGRLAQTPELINQGDYTNAALALAAPLGIGAIGSIGANTAKQFLNNTFNPVAASHITHTPALVAAKIAAKKTLQKQGASTYERGGKVKDKKSTLSKLKKALSLKENLGNLDTKEGYFTPLNQLLKTAVGIEGKDYSNESMEPIAREQDALRMYLGLPTKTGAFEQTGPNKYRIRDYNKLYPDTLLSDEAVRNWGIPNEDGVPDPVNPAFDLYPYDDFVMGKHYVTKGKDAKGEYLKYSDRFDFDPTRYANQFIDRNINPTMGKYLKKATPLLDELESLIFNPFELEDKIYYDPKTKLRSDIILQQNAPKVYPGQPMATPPEFAKGGKVNAPIYVDNRNDPRLKKYQDSLALFNASNMGRVNSLLKQGYKYDTDGSVKNNRELTPSQKKQYQKAMGVNPNKFLQNIIQDGNDGIKDNREGGKKDLKKQAELMHGQIAPIEMADLFDNLWRNSEYLQGELKNPMPGYDKTDKTYRKNPNYGKPLAKDKEGEVIRNFFSVPIYKKPVQPVILNVGDNSTINTTKGKVSGKVAPNDVKGSKLIQVRKEIKPENTNFNVNANGEFSTPEDYVESVVEQMPIQQTPVPQNFQKYMQPKGYSRQGQSGETQSESFYDAKGKMTGQVIEGKYVPTEYGKFLESGISEDEYLNQVQEFADGGKTNNDMKDKNKQTKSKKYKNTTNVKNTNVGFGLDIMQSLAKLGKKSALRKIPYIGAGIDLATSGVSSQTPFNFIPNPVMAGATYGLDLLNSSWDDKPEAEKKQVLDNMRKVQQEMQGVQMYPAGGYLNYQDSYKGFGVGPQLYQDNSYFRSVMPSNIENMEEEINKPSVFSGINDVLGAVNQGVSQATGLMSQFSQPTMGGYAGMSADAQKSFDFNKLLNFAKGKTGSNLIDTDLESIAGRISGGMSGDGQVFGGLPGGGGSKGILQGMSLLGKNKNGGYLRKYQNGGNMDMLPVGYPEYIHKSNVFHENYNPVPRVHFSDDTTPYDMGVNLNDLVNMYGGRVGKYQYGGMMPFYSRQRSPRVFNSNANRASAADLESAYANDFMHTKVRKDRQSFEDDKVDWGFMDWAKEPVGALTGVLSTVPIVGDITQSALGDSFLTRTGGYAVGKGVGNVGMGAAKVIGGAATGNVGMIGSGIGDVGEGVGSTVGTFQAKDALSNYDKSGYVSGNRLVRSSQDFGNMMDTASSLYGNVTGGVGMVKNMGGLKGMLGNMKGGATGMKGFGNIMGKITGFGQDGGYIDYDFNNIEEYKYGGKVSQKINKKQNKAGWLDQL